MQKYSIKTVLRTDKKEEKTGLCPLSFQVIINGKPFKYAVISGKIHPNWWDKKKGQVDVSKLPKTTTPIAKTEYQQLNQYLEDKCVSFKCFMRENDLRGQVITKERVDEFFKQRRSKKSFFDFWDECVEVKILQNDIKPATVKSYADTKKILKSFRPRLCFEDIDSNFIERFQKYLENERGNCTNGLFNRHKNLKAVLAYAVKKGITKDNPYSDRPIQWEQTDREFLELHELIALKNLVLPKEHQKLSDVKDMLLFCCYTSFRFSDMQDLKWQHVNMELKRIQKRQRKTSKPIFIKLIQLAVEILTHQFERKDKGEFVFKRIENQSINRSIKTLMKLAGIHKDISFHCARHTFAMLHIENGTTIHQIQDLLGHSSIAITQIYAKNMQQHLDKVMTNYGGMLSSN